MNYSANCRIPARPIDQFFNTVLKGLEPTPSVSRRAGLPISVFESETHYTLSAEVPGVLPEALTLTITADTLKLEVEKSAPEALEGTTPLLNEHRFGSFARTLNFRDAVDPDGSVAKLESGVLTVTVPKVRDAQPRRIEILQG